MTSQAGTQHATEQPAEAGAGDVQVEPSPKRLRIQLGGEAIADSTSALLVWEVPYYPAYYVPRADVRAKLEPTGTTSHHEKLGDAVHYTVHGAGGRTAVDAAWCYPDAATAELREAVRFDWGAMDAWFEEDEEVFVHPRDPFKRIDILPSSRHVKVIVDGTVVAESHRPWLLFETSLPTRYYLPKVDVRMDLLAPNDHATSCPYKGDASYWSVGAQRNVAWSYRSPVDESARIRGLVCFFNERIDLEVDGVRLERPQSPFS